MMCSDITVQTSPISYLHCNTCGKQVSTGFYPIPTDTPDKGMIVRAYVECPECIGNKESDRGRVKRRIRELDRTGRIR